MLLLMAGQGNCLCTTSITKSHISWLNREGRLLKVDFTKTDILLKLIFLIEFFLPNFLYRIYFTENLFTKIIYTIGFKCVYLSLFLGIRLIACPTFYDFFLEVLKVLSLCGLQKSKITFLAILLYVKFYV
jgi:hypothetical protein